MWRSVPLVLIIRIVQTYTCFSCFLTLGNLRCWRVKGFKILLYFEDISSWGFERLFVNVNVIIKFWRWTHKRSVILFLNCFVLLSMDNIFAFFLICHYKHTFGLFYFFSFFLTLTENSQSLINFSCVFFFYMWSIGIYFKVWKIGIIMARTGDLIWIIIAKSRQIIVEKTHRRVFKHFINKWMLHSLSRVVIAWRWYIIIRWKKKLSWNSRHEKFVLFPLRFTVNVEGLEVLFAGLF